MANPTDTRPTFAWADEQPEVTWGLIIDILDTLEAHGFRKSAHDREVGRAIGMILPMVKAYTGTGDE